MTKHDKLLRLMAEIHTTLFLKGKEAWFFPRRDGVRGYFGTGTVMFVGINPSFGRFPSEGTTFLYNALKSLGFHDAHITDVIKQRLTNDESRGSEAKKRLLAKHWKWLEEEMRILGRVRIVAMGNEAFNILKERLPNRIFKIPHYSWVEKYSEKSRRKKRKEVIKQLKAIRKEIRAARHLRRSHSD